MAYNKNLNIGPNSVTNISGSLITVTGSLFGTQISGTTAQFTTVSASVVSASTYYGLNLTASVMTGSELNIDHIDFTGQTPTPDWQSGRVYYNGAGSYFAGTEITDLNVNLGQQLVLRCINKSGQTISSGSVVHIVSSSNMSDTPSITTASYSAEISSAQTLGVVMRNIQNTAEGYVILNGILTKIDTSAYTVGQMLYLSETGSITAIAPTAPKHNVRIGQVIRASQNGTIFVRVQNGYELDEIHDVLVANKQNGDLLTYNSSNGLWTNSQNLSGSYQVGGNLTVTGTTNLTVLSASIISASQYVGPIGGGGTPGGTNTTVQFNSGSTFSGSSDFIWNYQTNRLGIGTTTPTAKLQIVSSISEEMLTVKNTGPSNWVQASFERVDDTQQQMAVKFYSAATAAPSTPTWYFGVAMNSYNYSVQTWNGSTLTQRFVVTPAGNVGIGTTSPESTLTVMGDTRMLRNIAVGEYGAELGFGVDGVYQSAAITPKRAASSGATDLVFRSWTGSSFTEKMIIAAGGNIGIGTNNPSSKLNLVDGKFIQNSNDTNDVVMRTYPTSGTGKNRIIDMYDSADINNSANLTIGIAPTTGWVSSIGGAYVISSKNGTGTTQDLYLLASDPPIDNTLGITIKAGTGNVGIGTITPTAKLDINGNAIVSNNLTVSGSITELSTRRIKTNITSLNNQLTAISKLNPVSYNRIDDGRKEYGFISEEVKEVYPEFVVGEGINYPKMVSVLVSAVKELTEKVEKQQSEIELLKNKKKITRGKK